MFNHSIVRDYLSSLQTVAVRGVVVLLLSGWLAGWLAGGGVLVMSTCVYVCVCVSRVLFEHLLMSTRLATIEFHTIQVTCYFYYY